LRALQIGANGQGARIELLQFSDGSIKIEQTDVTDNQSPNARVSGDATDNGGRSVKTRGRARGDCEMHHEDIRSLGELDETRVGTGLVGAEHD
jgi:hypothetical protein